MRLRALFALALLATPAFAEKAPINFHLDPSAGFGLDSFVFTTGATLKVDTTLIEALGPLAPQIQVFGYGAGDNTYLQQGALFGAGLGARLRLFNDEQGYLFNPGSAHTGNLWGNLWLDAHFNFNSGGFGPGFDVGVGAELSLVDGLNVGPFAKFVFAAQRPQDSLPLMFLQFGLSFTIGAPQTTPAEADFDNDGIKGDSDKCIDEAEDMDGFEDEDGCPEPDNDKDGVNDDKDQCPNEAEDKDGIADTDGCPETDHDGDGVLDTDDKCPNKKGPADNNGCPSSDKDGDGVPDHLDRCPGDKGSPDNGGCLDTDRDGDGVVDRLDKCPDEQGAGFSGGCPLPDADKDGTADEYDNCPADPGPVENSGCPAAKKQLVQLTETKLVTREKLAFDNGKATLQAKSNKLLDQVAEALKSHPAITLVEVEGHTDNSGSPEAGRTLSMARAQAVVDALVKKGVEAGRLKATGLGPDQPVADNGTAAGREQNHRIEFKLTR